MLYTVKKNCLVNFIYAVLILVLSGFHVEAQESPISVHTIQNISFGTYFQGHNGGTVNISNKGSRTVSGDIIPARMGSYYPAIIELEAVPGSIISILQGEEIKMYGSNGGYLTLQLSEPDKGSSFMIPEDENSENTLIRIGGTLIIGDAQSSPSGNYSGDFSITFVYE